MILIVGLGNVGEQYKNTKHNIGFSFLDYIASLAGATWTLKKNLKSEVASISYGSDSVLLCKPSTYMNLSGDAVLALLSYYKIKPSCLLVLHDELDLEFIDIRYKFSGGNAGHNGLKSIDSKIGTNYHRIRFGIGRPSLGAVSDYVLSKFSSDQLSQYQEKFARIKDLPEILLGAIKNDNVPQEIKKYLANNL